MENSTDVPINFGWVYVKFPEGLLVYRGVYDPIVLVEQPPAVLMCPKLQVPVDASMCWCPSAH